MLWELILQVAVALFAVFGFYCALRLFADLFFASEQIVVAVEIRDQKDAEMLDVLLHEAWSAFFRKRHGRLVVLLSYELMDGRVGVGEVLFPAYLEILERWGAECYLIDP